MVVDTPTWGQRTALKTELKGFMCLSVNQYSRGSETMSRLDISRIRELMKEKQFTQAKLAEKIGIDETTVSKWLTGKSVPKENLGFLAQTLGVDESELVETAPVGVVVKSPSNVTVHNHHTTINNVNFFVLKDEDAVKKMQEILGIPVAFRGDDS